MAVPLVSVIIPVYNVERYIHRCLDSLIAQTLRDIEIICVNDCSTDASLRILREYEERDDRVVVIDLPRNIRQGGARNIGIRKARAAYLGFVDSDDWVAPEMYERLYALARESGAELVCGDYFSYYGESDIRPQVNIRPDVFSLSRDEQNKCFIVEGCRLWTNVIKKELFFRHELFFPEELSYEDNAVVTALYVCARSIRKDNHPYYYYRCDNASTTRGLNNYRFFDRLRTSKMFVENMRRLGLYERYPQEVEFRFTELFYIHSILGAITQFDPSEQTYIDQIKHEMNVLFPHFKANPYYRKRISFRLRCFFGLIGFRTDWGIRLYKLLRR